MFPQLQCPIRVPVTPKSPVELPKEERSSLANFPRGCFNETADTDTGHEVDTTCRLECDSRIDFNRDPSCHMGSRGCDSGIYCSPAALPRPSPASVSKPSSGSVALHRGRAFCLALSFVGKNGTQGSRNAALQWGTAVCVIPAAHVLARAVART